MKKMMLLMGLLLVSPLIYAEEPIDTYTAKLSSEDHFNSNGERLKSVADIIRQDRANYHKFNVRDAEDQGDGFFGDADSRERIPKMLKNGHIDKVAQKSILNGSPVVTVSIYRNHIEVYLQ